MQKLKSIVVENDPKSLSLLLSLISDYCPELEVVSSVSNIYDATRQILTQQPELIFLDIELDDGLGFDLLYNIPDRKFFTIVISGYSKYAFDSYKFEVIHYLLKPISIRELRIAIDRVLQFINTFEKNHEILKPIQNNITSQKKIQISTTDGIKLFNLNEIEYLQADGSYTIFHFINKETFIASKPIKSYEHVLSESNFYRISRTHIINLNYIKVFNKNVGISITMNSDCIIVVPRRNKDEFLQYLNSYMKMFK